MKQLQIIIIADRLPLECWIDYLTDTSSLIRSKFIDSQSEHTAESITGITLLVEAALSHNKHFANPGNR